MSRENWWLDFLEGELDTATVLEMRAVLRHSLTDQKIFQALAETKKLVADHAPPPLNVEDHFFDRMHDKIMAKVNETAITPPPQQIAAVSERRLYLRK